MVICPIKTCGSILFCIVLLKIIQSLKQHNAYLMTGTCGLSSLTQLSSNLYGSNTAISVLRTSAKTPISIDHIKPRNKLNKFIIHISSIILVYIV